MYIKNLEINDGGYQHNPLYINQLTLTATSTIQTLRGSYTTYSTVGFGVAINHGVLQGLFVHSNGTRVTEKHLAGRVAWPPTKRFFVAVSVIILQNQITHNEATRSVLSTPQYCTW